MDYGELLTRALRIVSFRNGLWLFAFIGALGGIFFTILINGAMLWFGRVLIGSAWFDGATGIASFFTLPRVILLSGALLVAGTLFWLMSAIAEAGLILGVWQVRVSGELDIRKLFVRAMQLIGKMAVIDSILFLPLFILLLAILLVTAGILFLAIVLVSGSGTATIDLSSIFGIGLVILIPLALLLLLILIVTPLVRIFSFRVAILEEMNAWRSITTALSLMKINIWSIIIIAGLLFALSNLVTFPIRTIGTIVTGVDLGRLFLELRPNTFLSLGLDLVNVITILVGSMVSIFLYYLGSTVWTLMYGEITQ